MSNLTFSLDNLKKTFPTVIKHLERKGPNCLSKISPSHKLFENCAFFESGTFFRNMFFLQQLLSDEIKLGQDGYWERFCFATLGCLDSSLLTFFIWIWRASATYTGETINAKYNLYERTNSTARLSRKYSSSVLSRERILWWHLWFISLCLTMVWGVDILQFTNPSPLKQLQKVRGGKSFL